jgi:glutamate dehydrogenase
MEAIPMKSKVADPDHRTDSLAEVIALVRAKVAPDQQKTLEAFVARYLAQVDPEDLAERRPADLYGAALSHWNFARKREPGKPKLRVFNPTLEEHGWQSTHTIIEIVNDDMPFLVDSVTMEVNRHGLTLHLIIHPLLLVDRDAEGTLRELGTEGTPSARRESFIHVEVDRITDPKRLETLAADVTRVLGDVRLAVTDWKAMQDKVLAVVAELEKNPPPIPPEQFQEGLAFLRWLAANHLTLLGYRRHELVTVDGQDALKIVPGSSLGLLRDGATKKVSSSFAALPPEVRAYARRPELLVITKATTRSTVHRPGYLDYIAVKRFDAAGNVCGEDRFLGLYTSTAYSANPADIPLLRRKTANVVARSACRRVDMRARRSSISSPTIRATNCSRSPKTSCCKPRWRSCASASASVSACSCAGIRSNASCHALSTRRGRISPRACAGSGRRSSPRRSTAAAPNSTSTFRSRCWRASRSPCARHPARFPSSTCTNWKRGWPLRPDAGTTT